jgi:hypothetical protein
MTIQKINASAFSAAGITAVLVGVLLLPFITKGDTDAAVSYLKTKTPSAWTSMALAAHGETPDVSYLKNTSIASAIGLEAPIMAIAAAGHDPRTYANADLVAALKGFYAGGQIGDTSTLNDDVFGVLALVAAGESVSDTVVAGTKQYILNNQNTDGGWGFAVGGASDTNTTAAAIQALIAAGVSPSNSSIVNAFAYLRGAQNDDGGFPYDPNSAWGTDSDASSGAWVISALNAAGIDPVTWSKGSNTPVSHLLSLQDDAGFFAYQAGGTEDAFSAVTTAYVVIALSGATLPVATFTAPAPLVSFRIEGSADVVCVGETYASDALEVVRDAADICGFTYSIDQLSFGPYLSAIGGDVAEGMIGWMYRVNHDSPSVGAGDYVLKSGDEVLWYYGDFAWTLLRITLSDTEITEGESDPTAIVESYEGNVWSKVSGATVVVGNSSYTTNTSGEVVLTPSDGVYDVYAIKDGHIRSAALTLVVGEKHEQKVGLSAVIGESGQGGDDDQTGGTVSFSVNPNDVSFGTIQPGSSARDDVTISNDGSDAISVRSNVSGDEVFRTFITIDNTSWRTWGRDIVGGDSHTADVLLTIPSTYSGTGAKSGDLIFWAIGQ